MKHPLPFGRFIARLLDPRDRALRVLQRRMPRSLVRDLDLIVSGRAAVCSKCGAVYPDPCPNESRLDCDPGDEADLNIGAFVEAGCRALCEP